MKTAYFGHALFDFLRDLRAHNERAWFQANQQRYEAQVKAPLLRFIGDIGPGLRKISPRFVADPRPVGGSMFRIYRDTRFSKDKTPYKTHVAAHFRHKDGGRDVHATGFYMHLAPEPDRSVGGGGLWRPDAPALKRVRDRIASKKAEWHVVRKTGMEILGDALKRPPAGYDAAHPYVEDLKRKDFYTMTDFSEKAVCAPDFMERYLDACRKAAPLMAFLTKALGLRF